MQRTPAARPAQRAAADSSPAWLLVLCTASMLAALGLWPIGQTGDDLACSASVVLALLATKWGFEGLKAWDERRALDAIHSYSKEVSGVHGEARWAMRKDTERAGMHDPSGLFLGRFEGRDLFFPGETSLLTIAPPGAGKTTSLAVQHLLRSPRSTIVADPKLELWSITHKARERMGQRVWAIIPWEDDFRRQFDGRVDVRDDGFDPCSFLEPSRSSIIDDCTMLASLLIPQNTTGANETEDFFRDFSQSILVAWMLLGLSRAGRVTLPGLRRSIMAPRERLEADIAAMVASSAFSGVLAEYGARLAGPLVNAAKEWQGGHSGSMKALRLYDAHGPLGRHVEHAGVDWSTFKDEPTTVYIAQPSDKVVTHASWMGMVVTLAMEGLVRDRRKVPCTFLLDEFQNLGRLEPILKGIAAYRGSGIQFWFLVQFVPALKRLYGESWREFFGVDLVNAFGAPADIETLDMLSRLTGQTTTRGFSFSSSSLSLGEPLPGVGLNAQEVARPLLRPEEIRTLPDDQQIIFKAGMPPILATKESYLNNPQLRRLAAPNPYYTARGTDRV